MKDPLASLSFPFEGRMAHRAGMRRTYQRVTKNMLTMNKEIADTTLMEFQLLKDSVYQREVTDVSSTVWAAILAPTSEVWI